MSPAVLAELHSFLPDAHASLSRSLWRAAWMVPSFQLRDTDSLVKEKALQHLLQGNGVTQDRSQDRPPLRTSSQEEGI